MGDLVRIDGAWGEGGGQILRTALALGAITGRPLLKLENIRAKRAKPGLMRQHLTALRAAAEISGADASGARIGATSIGFRPGSVRAGDYHFAVGTAGSATLVAQTVLPALLRATAPSRLVLEGGTHNPASPPFEFLARAFLPLLRRMGVEVDARLVHRGFYPAGGGRFELDVRPPPGLAPLRLLDRGAPAAHEAEAVIAHLPDGIAARELEVVAERLGWPEARRTVLRDTTSPGPGNVLLLTLAFEAVSDVVTGFGMKGVGAESLARKAATQAERCLASPAAVGVHLADQLLLPMALAGAGAFTTLRPSRHTRTNIEVIQRFLEIPIRLEEVGRELWQIEIGA